MLNIFEHKKTVKVMPSPILAFKVSILKQHYWAF